MSTRNVKKNNDLPNNIFFNIMNEIIRVFWHRNLFYSIDKITDVSIIIFTNSFYLLCFLYRTKKKVAMSLFINAFESSNRKEK